MLPHELDQRAKILAATERETNQRQGYKMRSYFPDTGPYRRELYPKHVACMAAGALHRERLFMAANRIGKSDMGAYETAVHLTGLYPPWWTGKRFSAPIKAWAAGDTSKTARDIIQPKLLGEREAQGTGMIPAHTIYHVSYKPNGAGMVDTIWVTHAAGGHSKLSIKSYAEGRESFQGTEIHVCWLDEEPPQDVYTECLMRTMTCEGIVLLTFTPLSGVTELILSFLKTAPPSPAVPAVRLSSDGVTEH